MNCLDETCILKARELKDIELDHFLSTHPVCLSCYPDIQLFFREIIDRYPEVVMKYNYCLWCMLRGNYAELKKKSTLEALKSCQSCKFSHIEHNQKQIQLTLF